MCSCSVSNFLPCFFNKCLLLSVKWREPIGMVMQGAEIGSIPLHFDLKQVDINWKKKT